MFPVVDLLSELDEPARFEVLLLFYGLLKSEADRLEVQYRKFMDPEMHRAFQTVTADLGAVFGELLRYAPGYSKDVLRRPTN